MVELSRRRNPEAPDECWHVFYGDVRVGTIAIRTGIPRHENPWGWACGFYPGSHPAECTSGAAATFDQARVEFEDAWRVFLSKRTKADFETWRAQRDWTARKYAMWQAFARPARPDRPFRRYAVLGFFALVRSPKCHAAVAAHIAGVRVR